MASEGYMLSKETYLQTKKVGDAYKAGTIITPGKGLRWEEAAGPAGRKLGLKVKELVLSVCVDDPANPGQKIAKTYTFYVKPDPTPPDGAG